MDIVDDVDMFFTFETEMDATVRVVQLLLVVCKDIYDSTQQRVKVQCQPKFGEHPIFTDFLICKTDDTPKLIIEVKRSTIYTSLHLKSKEAAQTFKEVHIVTEKTSTLPFLLTNSVMWNFGVAQRVGNKVSIISSLEVNVKEGSYNFVYKALGST